KTGYDRALFGQQWSDDVNVEGGHNGCDTRNDILRRDLTDITVKPGTRGCVVLSGTLHDAYTGKTIPFVRGQGTSSAV
ncbi:deoxyribonuclease, partial [Gordonia paraffinivorans]|nr:deoxyribonuclease [Gordonia paraffinivorans]